MPSAQKTLKNWSGEDYVHPPRTVAVKVDEMEIRSSTVSGMKLTSILFTPRGAS